MSFKEGLNKFTRGSMNFMISSLSSPSTLQGMDTKKITEIRANIQNYAVNCDNSSDKIKAERALKNVDRELKKRNVY